MNISDCLYHEQINLGKTIQSNLNAHTLEEIELIQSVAKLLYKTKSIRSAIVIIDYLAQSEYCIQHSFPPEIIFNNSDMTNQEILDKHESIPYTGC